MSADPRADSETGAHTMVWQRAVLPLLMLRILAAEPRHGYGVSQTLMDAGLLPVKGAQLYPALVALEADGAVEASWQPGESGPARKVYELTASGRAYLIELEREWQAFTTSVDSLAERR